MAIDMVFSMLGVLFSGAAVISYFLKKKWNPWFSLVMTGLTFTVLGIITWPND